MAMGSGRGQVRQILRAAAAGVALTTFVLPVGLDYERRPPRTWRQLTCAYSVSEITRGAGLAVRSAHGDDACALLRRLGLDVERWSLMSGAAPQGEGVARP